MGRGGKTDDVYVGSCDECEGYGILLDTSYENCHISLDEIGVPLEDVEVSALEGKEDTEKHPIYDPTPERLHAWAAWAQARMGLGDINLAALLNQAAAKMEILEEVAEAAEKAERAGSEPCSCGVKPYYPCAHCDPFLKLGRALRELRKFDPEGRNDE